MGALGGEFVKLVGVFENFFNVDSLNGCEAVFDEEGVGLPIRRIGAAVCRCEIFERWEVDGRVEGSCKCQGEERKEDGQHCDRGM